MKSAGVKCGNAKCRLGTLTYSRREAGPGAGTLRKVRAAPRAGPALAVVKLMSVMWAIFQGGKAHKRVANTSSRI